jgi:hypothetical protein
MKLFRQYETAFSNAASSGPDVSSDLDFYVFYDLVTGLSKDISQIQIVFFVKRMQFFKFQGLKNIQVSFIRYFF